MFFTHYKFNPHHRILVILGITVASNGETETLVRKGGITNHRLIAYCLSNVCPKLSKSYDVR